MISTYFAYGSNMDPARVQSRGLPFTALCAAALPGHRLVFDKQSRHRPEAGHANIRVQQDSVVHGVLYTLATPADIARMDPFEQTPVNYSREVFILRVAAAAGAVGAPMHREVPAWVYVGNSGVLRAGLLPESEYLAHLLAGAPFLPCDYLADLRAQPCLPPSN